MITIEEAIEKFNNELPPLVQSEFGAEEVVVALQNLEKKYHISFIHLAILVAINEVSLDTISAYLEKEQNLQQPLATQISKDLKEEIFNPLLERLHFLNSDPEKRMNLDQEKSFAERIFRAGLIKELKHDAQVIKFFNERLFYILSQDENYSEQLEKAIYNNTEIIYGKDILLNEQPVSPTIGNWLKDYIAQYGSQTFDSMSQTNFLLNSVNGRKLTETERDLLGKILKIYINVKFFPDSMPSDDGTGWEIIPGGESLSIQKSTFNDVEFEEVGQSGISKSEIQPREVSLIMKKPITPLAKSVLSSNIAVPKVLNTVVENPSVFPADSDELINLKNMLLQYPPDSLERKAIEEEIKNLSL